MRDGEELVEEPFSRIIQDKKLVAFPYTGFWQAMDTFKDKINFDRSYARGDVPWQVWKR
jgi:glucose-1-phosphate cytidylyltransferase